jgi:hypothetical protein
VSARQQQLDMHKLRSASLGETGSPATADARFAYLYVVTDSRSFDFLGSNLVILRSREQVSDTFQFGLRVAC